MSGPWGRHLGAQLASSAALLGGTGVNTEHEDPELFPAPWAQGEAVTDTHEGIAQGQNLPVLHHCQPLPPGLTCIESWVGLTLRRTSTDVTDSELNEGRNVGGFVIHSATAIAET